jgi:hypothetical protein
MGRANVMLSETERVLAGGAAGQRSSVFQCWAFQ